MPCSNTLLQRGFIRNFKTVCEGSLSHPWLWHVRSHWQSVLVCQTPYTDMHRRRRPLQTVLYPRSKYRWGKLFAVCLMEVLGHLETRYSNQYPSPFLEVIIWSSPDALFVSESVGSHPSLSRCIVRVSGEDRPSQ